MKKFYLFNGDDEYPISVCRLSQFGTTSADGICTEVTSWVSDCNINEEKFFADFMVKWDSCSHFDFYGEDLLVGDKDSYYHICGVYDYIKKMQMLWFCHEVSQLHCDNICDKEEKLELNKNVLFKDFRIVEKPWTEEDSEFIKKININRVLTND